MPNAIHNKGDLLRLDSEYLQDKRFVMLCDSQDLDALWEEFDVHPTGALVHAEDGEYREVWITHYSRSYSLSAVYELVHILDGK